jgi:histidine phosphotransfer protein HptB
MTTGQRAEAHFCSLLADDPDLADLVQMFVDEMPRRIADLREFRAAGDWDGVARCAHQLKGAAGSYGFHQLTPYAAALEAAVRDESAPTGATVPLQALIEACSRVSARTSHD